MPSLIVAGLGTAQSKYDPPITEAGDVITLHSQMVFTPAVPTSDVPPRLLVSARIDGTFEAECTGSATDVNLHGTLRWSDGTTSAFEFDTPTVAELVQGHAVGHIPGTITNGHYQGARIDALGLAFAGDVAACLSGRGVSDSTGASVIIVTAA
ncbi:hypothetical protein ACH40F_43675 [Streptomyces sp. NPDC020794]|uniref:hypothetical protein n=1 Tax=unclassified Streptomyces TaxID=2593676 RepID=UPI0036EB3120